MAKVIHGETYWYVDTIYDDDLIYDIYQNDRDEVVYIAIGCLY